MPQDTCARCPGAASALPHRCPEDLRGDPLAHTVCRGVRHRAVTAASRSHVTGGDVTSSGRPLARGLPSPIFGTVRSVTRESPVQQCELPENGTSLPRHCPAVAPPAVSPLEDGVPSHCSVTNRLPASPDSHRPDHPFNKVGRICGQRISDHAIYAALRKPLVEAGVARLSPHDLRRTFVSDLLDAGIDLATVRRLAGHTSSATKRRAVEALHVPYVGDAGEDTGR